MMTGAFRGLFRTADGAYIANGVMGFHVPEANYRAFRYEPDFDKLPWQEQYSAAKASHADNDPEHVTQ